MRAVQIFLACLGRILISLIFILSAIGHMLDWPRSLQMLSGGLQTWSAHSLSMPKLLPVIEQMQSHTSLLMGIAVIFMLLGGLLVFFGIKTRFGAFLLTMFILATTLTMHNFWFLQGPDRELQMIMFMKNLAILGGLFYLLAFGNGGSKKPKAEIKEKQ